MDKLLKYLFHLCLITIIIGPLGVLPLAIPSVNLYFSDIFVFLICLTLLTQTRKMINIIKKDKISVYFFIFISLSFISLILSPITLTIIERLISFLYLMRLAAYFGVYLAAVYLLKRKITTSRNIIAWMSLIGAILVLLGWVQYFLYPNLRNLYYLGWDPHLKRIFATYLDPNYFGIILVLILLILFFIPKANVAVWIFRSVTFLTLMFTYSRSSYLALLVAVLFYAILKRKYAIFGTTIILVFLLSALLPRPEGIGVRLERVFSVVERIENWQQGITLFAKHPLMGAGFNTVRYAKRQYGLNDADLMVSHAGAGFDNSFIFIAVTTGIIGLITYLLFLKKAFIQGNLLVKISLIAITTHSFFLNSLFFPWVMLWMWVVIGLNDKKYSNSEGDPSSLRSSG